MTETAAPPIPGMKVLAFRGYMKSGGTIWGKIDDDGVPIMGFWVEPHHCNAMELCHGGMLMTFADTLLIYACAVAAGGKKFTPTVSMSCDFVGPAPLDSWVQGKGRLVRRTRNLAFMETIITANGEPSLRASGIMKIPAGEDRERDIFRLFR